MQRSPKSIVSVIAIIAMGAAGALWHGHKRAQPPRPTTSVATPRASNAAIPSLWPPVGPAAVSSADLTGASATVEVCGAGRVAVDPNNPFRVQEVISKLTDPRSAEWLSALLNSDDNRARAAGLMLQGKLGNGAFEGQVMTEDARDALVQLAVGAGDPAIYAMAIYACHSYGNPVTDGACPQLSLSTWAQMDASNAVPWLLLAEQSRVRGDDAGATNAFTQAAKAQKVESYNFSLFAFADLEQPKDTTSLERWAFATQVSGVEAVLRPPLGNDVQKFCTDEAMQDSTVRQQCNDVAELYVAKSNTVLDFALGGGMGKRLGWAPERVDSLNEQKLAMMESLMEVGPVGNDLWSCDATARGNAYWHQRLRLGELGAARDAMAQTGDPAGELVRKFGERMSKFSENSQPSE